MKSLNVFVVCMAFAFLSTGCDSKPAERTEGLSPEQVAIDEAFRIIVDRTHSVSLMKEQFAKSAKPSTADLKKLSKYHVQIMDPETDIKVSGNTATVTVTLQEYTTQAESTKDWKLVKEGDKWLLTEVSA